MGWTTNSAGQVVDDTTGLPVPSESNNLVLAFPSDGSEISSDSMAVSAAPVENQDSSMATRFESWIGNLGTSVKTFDSNAASWVVTEAKSGYETVKNAAGTVAGDIAKPITSIVDYGTTKIYILVALLAVGLYFVGRGGLVGQATGRK